jgi:hypothetical protein
MAETLTEKLAARLEWHWYEWIMPALICAATGLMGFFLLMGCVTVARMMTEQCP